MLSTKNADKIINDMKMKLHEIVGTHRGRIVKQPEDYSRFFDYQAYENVLKFTYNYMVSERDGKNARALSYLLEERTRLPSKYLGPTYPTEEEMATADRMIADVFAYKNGITIWDFKPKLKESRYCLKARVKEASGTLKKNTTVFFTPISNDDRYVYYYDMWSNIAFGYIARSIGFNEIEIFTGNYMHNFISGVDDDANLDDQFSIELGIKLFDQRKNKLSEADLSSCIYENRLKFKLDTTRMRPENLMLLS